MAWVRFHARYYVVALFFVLFDLEARFSSRGPRLPARWGRAGCRGILSFVGVLMVGWLWALKKGALRWQ